MPAPRRTAPAAAGAPATAAAEPERGFTKEHLLEAIPRVELESTMVISDQVLANSSVPEQLRAIVQRFPDLWQMVRVGTTAFRLLLHSQVAQKATPLQLCNTALEVASALEAEVANTAHSLPVDATEAVKKAAAEAASQLDTLEEQISVFVKDSREHFQTEVADGAFPTWNENPAYDCLLGKDSAPTLLIWPPHVRQCVLVLMSGIERRPGSVKRAIKTSLPVSDLGIDADIAAFAARSVARRKDGTDLFMLKEELMITATLYQALARCVIVVGDELGWPQSARSALLAAAKDRPSMESVHFTRAYALGGADWRTDPRGALGKQPLPVEPAESEVAPSRSRGANSNQVLTLGTENVAPSVPVHATASKGPQWGLRQVAALPTTPSLKQTATNSEDCSNLKWVQHANWAYRDLRFPASIDRAHSVDSELLFYKWCQNVLQKRNLVMEISERQVIEHVSHPWGSDIPRKEHTQLYLEGTGTSCTVAGWLEALRELFFPGHNFRRMAESGWVAHRISSTSTLHALVDVIRKYYSIIFLDHDQMPGDMCKHQFAQTLCDKYRHFVCKCESPLAVQCRPFVSTIEVQMLSRDCLRPFVATPRTAEADEHADRFVLSVIQGIMDLRIEVNLASSAQARTQGPRIDLTSPNNGEGDAERPTRPRHPPVNTRVIRRHLLNDTKPSFRDKRKSQPPRPQTGSPTGPARPTRPAPARKTAEELRQLVAELHEGSRSAVRQLMAQEDKLPESCRVWSVLQTVVPTQVYSKDSYEYFAAKKGHDFGDRAACPGCYKPNQGVQALHPGDKCPGLRANRAAWTLWQLRPKDRQQDTLLPAFTHKTAPRYGPKKRSRDGAKAAGPAPKHVR